MSTLPHTMGVKIKPVMSIADAKPNDVIFVDSFNDLVCTKLSRYLWYKDVFENH